MNLYLLLASVVWALLILLAARPVISQGPAELMILFDHGYSRPTQLRRYLPPTQKPISPNPKVTRKPHVPPTREEAVKQIKGIAGHLLNAAPSAGALVEKKLGDCEKILEGRASNALRMAGKNAPDEPPRFDSYGEANRQPAKILLPPPLKTTCREECIHREVLAPSKLFFNENGAPSTEEIVQIARICPLKISQKIYESMAKSARTHYDFVDLMHVMTVALIKEVDEAKKSSNEEILGIYLEPLVCMDVLAINRTYHLASQFKESSEVLAEISKEEERKGKLKDARGYLKCLATSQEGRVKRLLLEYNELVGRLRDTLFATECKSGATMQTEDCTLPLGTFVYEKYQDGKWASVDWAEEAEGLREEPPVRQEANKGPGGKESLTVGKRLAGVAREVERAVGSMKKAFDNSVGRYLYKIAVPTNQKDTKTCTIPHRDILLHRASTLAEAKAYLRELADSYKALTREAKESPDRKRNQ